MNVGDVIQCRAVCTHLNQVAYMVRHYRVTDVTGVPSMALVAEEFENIISAQLKLAMSLQARFAGVDAKKIHPAPPSNAAVSIDDEGNGASEFDILPTQVCGLIRTWAEIEGGVVARGRAYVPFPSEEFNTIGGQPHASYVTLLSNLAIQYLENVAVVDGGNTLVMIPVIFHRATGVSTGITHATGSNKWATQRRRGSRDAADAGWPPVS